MKKNVSRVLAAALILSAMYFFLTPMGALRGAILLTGHPISAITLQTREAAAADVGLKELDNPPNTTIYKITHNFPHDEQTNSDLKNWIVTKYGIFYTANYYGWL